MDNEVLAEMRKQYKFATLKDHILVDGVLYRRCAICGIRPIPSNAGVVMWCDPCLDECCEGIDRHETISDFISKKKAQHG